MTTSISTRRHAFLSPGHNCWSVWTWEGTSTLTNPGASHRVLETLAFAIDKLVADGWVVRQIYVDQGTPSLVFLERDYPDTSGE